jgi:mercuric ion binding protein
MRKILLMSLLMFAPLAATALQPAAATGAPATQTVTLAVENMSCAACPITVRKALEKVPGVTKVKIDFDAKTATVAFDPAKAEVEDLTRATTDAGYPSSLKR